jgi:hypothetical protein
MAQKKEEPEEVKIVEEAEVHECKTCGVGQYFHAVKLAGGDWQGIVYEKCLPCKHNQMANTLGPLLRAIGREVPELDNWIPKKPIQGVDIKDALERGFLTGQKKE